MRLGLIGPCQGDQEALQKRAAFLLDEVRAERVIYLGMDRALDHVVRRWAEELVAGEPSDDAVWTRAAETCPGASPAKLDEFVRIERSRGHLKLLECLSAEDARTMEVFDGVISVIIHDKAFLDEDDILPASILVFGKGAEPLVHRVGQRVFVSPGPTAHAKGGSALIAVEDEHVVVTFYDSGGKLVDRQSLVPLSRGVRVTVQGASAQ